MARQRKSSVLLERSGAYRAHPSRRRKDPPGRGELPASPPPHLRFGAKLAAIWRELVAALPAGIATGSDRFVVERAVRLLHRARTDPNFKAFDETQLRAYLGALGLSPSARANLAAPGAGAGERENPFERFHARRSPAKPDALPN